VAYLFMIMYINLYQIRIVQVL